MKGLTLEQFKEVVEFSQYHHAFAGYMSEKQRAMRKMNYPNMSEYSLSIKYIDSCYDSRDKTIWSISFRQGSSGVRFSANHYTAINPPPKEWKYNNLFDLCMAYLKGEFKPKEEFYIKRD